MRAHRQRCRIALVQTPCSFLGGGTQRMWIVDNHSLLHVRLTTSLPRLSHPLGFLAMQCPAKSRRSRWRSQSSKKMLFSWLWGHLRHSRNVPESSGPNVGTAGAPAAASSSGPLLEEDLDDRNRVTKPESGTGRSQIGISFAVPKCILHVLSWDWFLIGAATACL